MSKLGDPFHPKTGEFHANIRSIVDDGTDAELEASLKQWGWVAEFPALVDERGVCLVGNRRLKIAGRLKIEPVIKQLTLGTGDAADAERFKLAITSNVGGKPMTKVDRQRIAEYLYGKREWTMARIGEALNVSQRQISTDLGGLEATSKPSRPKGGRPKNHGPKPEPVKYGRATRDQLASLVLDDGKSIKQATKETGVSSTVARTAVARELGRREARAEPPEIDVETFLKFAPKTWVEKYEVLRRQLEKQHAARFASEVRAESMQWLEAAGLPHYLETLTKLEAFVSNRRGVMDRATFNKIRRCLHPDTRKGLTDASLGEAFQLFAKCEKWLLDEKNSPTEFMKVPRTMAEMMALREKVRTDRRAKRAGHVAPRR